MAEVFFLFWRCLKSHWGEFKSNDNLGGRRRGADSVLPLPLTVSLCPAQTHFLCHLVFLVLALISTRDHDCSCIHTAYPCERSSLFSAVTRVPHRYELTAMLTIRICRKQASERSHLFRSAVRTRIDLYITS